MTKSAMLLTGPAGPGHEIVLRLEPLGLERVAAALLADGHDVRLIDLQVYSRAQLQRQVTGFRPEAVGFSLKIQAVLARKHLGFAALAKTTGIIARQLLRGQTNFPKMIWKFNQVYNANRQFSEHARAPLPVAASGRTASEGDGQKKVVHPCAGTAQILTVTRG